MSISKDNELDARIHNFLERKMKRFPEIANLNTEQGRSSLTVKAQNKRAGWSM